MLATLLINAQSIGTGTNAGEGLFPVKVTLQATTTAYVLSMRVTNGTDAYVTSDEVIVRYSTTPFGASYTAAQAVPVLGQTHRFVYIKLQRTAGLAIIKDSSIEPVTGGTLFIWCDIPKVATAMTLDVYLQELP